MSEIIVAHEHFVEWGGGEHVAEQLSDCFDAPIITGLTGAESDGYDVMPLLTGTKAAVARRSTLVRDVLYQLAWPNERRLDRYDLIIQSGNNPGWYVPRDHQAVVKYVHSTPRNPYDLLHEADSKLVRLYAMAARILYYHSIAYPDVFVFNSELTARRGELYWGLDRKSDRVHIVYPPVDVDSYGAELNETGDYYLALSRLVPSKRINEIIRTFNEINKPLVVAGDGPERDNLERMASSNVEFVGFVNEQEKRRMMSEAKAGVFAAVGEDFGMVPIELLASGTPVLAVNDGFTKYQIDDGKNGLLFERGPPSDDGYILKPGRLADIVEKFEREGVDLDTEEIEQTAEPYSIQAFRQGMIDAIDYATKQASINP